MIICGEVKNVGFRRHVWRYANINGLRGFIVNVDNTDCVASYIEGNPSRIDSFKNGIDSIITKYNVNRYQFIDLGRCIKLPEDYDGFEIYGCISDLFSRNIPKEIIESIRIKCEDYIG